MNTLGNDNLFVFDAFRIDADQRCLMHRGKLVPLTAKAFDTLLVLVENNGRIVEKEQLLNEVWADTFVEEATLAQNISTLRKAFAACDTGTQFIETVPRRGYRFLRDVHQIEYDDELYEIETRRSTMVLAEKTEIHITDPGRLAPIAFKFLQNHKLSLLGFSVAVIGVLIGTFMVGRQLIGGEPERFSSIETSTLVSSGDIVKMALSPDGKYIALVEYRQDLQSLLVKQPNSSNAVELIPRSNTRFVGLAFSPDGESIYYTAYAPDGETNLPGKLGRLYKIAVLGGPQTQIVDDVDSPVAISPDGKKFAFIRRVPNEESTKLVILEQDGFSQNERILSSRPITEPFSMDGLSWSPDGRSLSMVVYNEAATTDLVIVDTQNGEQRKLNAEPWDWIGQTAWLSGGKSIIFTAYREGTSNFTDEIWIANTADGSTRLVTDGIKGVSGISISRDSRSIAAVRANRVTSLWVGSAGGPGTATVINKSIGDFSQNVNGIDWTPDGRIVYDSAADGNSDIWIANADGTNTKKLTADRSADFMPTVSHDGRFIVFVSNRTGGLRLWRMEVDGTSPIQLSTLENISAGSISPDNLWVYFSGAETKRGRTFAWRVPIVGGEPEKVTDRICLSPQISPDGRYLACYYPQEIEPGKFGPPVRPTVLTANGSAILRQFRDLPIGHRVPITWTADGTGFTYALRKNGVSNVWFQSVEAAEPKQITDFQTDEIIRFRFSKDGKYLAFEKGFRVNDVLLIRDQVAGN